MVATNVASTSSLVNHNKDVAALSTIMEDHPEATTFEDPMKSGFNSVQRDNASWAGGSLPAAQGLYDPDNEKDACGVGYLCQMKGKPSHKIVIDARQLLCSLVHRGATGADARDGDGAGCMSGIPHEFFRFEVERSLGFTLPAQGQYASGNLFFTPKDDKLRAEHQKIFEDLASDLHLRVLGWREVPVDNSILGPAALSKEPKILQPFVVLTDHYGRSSTQCEKPNAPFDSQYFGRQLYVLRKSATHKIGLANWFYICSLSPTNIVYKGQLSPKQVYEYYYDLVNARYASHFALVHSRFSTNTFPSWDRAQPMRWAAHNGEWRAEVAKHFCNI
jgi:glutamate synthase (NADH)